MPDEEPLTEDQKVYRHRVVRFLVMGYSMEDAELLAAIPYVDTHEIQKLIDKGCDREMAAKICV